MTTQISRDMSEERLKQIETSLLQFPPDVQLQAVELTTEIRRLRQREADLESAANLWEELYKQDTENVRQEAYMEGWQDCEEHQKSRIDDDGEYARGVRI